MKNTTILLGLLMTSSSALAGSSTIITDAAGIGAAPGSAAVVPLQIENTRLSPPPPSNPSGIPIGPQSFLLNFVNGYTPGFVVDVSVTLSGGYFASVDSFAFYAKNANGALVQASVTGCSKTVSKNVLTFRACAVKSGTFDGLQVIGANYYNAAGLAKVGSSISAIAKVADPSTVYELSQPTTIVVSVAPADTGSPGTGSGGDSTGGTGSTGSSSGDGTGNAATPSVHMGPVFSSLAGQPQSFLRFYNSSLTAGTVAVVLSDPTTGNALYRWTSPGIPAGASVQFPLTAVENPNKGAAKPSQYAVGFVPSFPGAVAHVVWDTDKGALLDQTVCDSGKLQASGIVTNVHSTTVSGYPSRLVLTNTGSTTQAATLSITDADDGRFLGAYPTVPIPPGGFLTLPVSQIEAGANLDPVTLKATYYNVAISGQFTGFLQHLVVNLQSGVTTDLTEACGFDKTPG